MRHVYAEKECENEAVLRICKLHTIHRLHTHIVLIAICAVFFSSKRNSKPNTGSKIHCSQVHLKSINAHKQYMNKH